MPAPSLPGRIVRVAADGWLIAGTLRFPCALGRTGIVANKQEGDGGTPAGWLPLREVLYRADRIVPPATRLPLSPIARDDGWCDDPTHPDYNRRVRLPHPARCETLWREDGLYDLLAVLGWNDDPPVANAGSAIFLPAARPNYAPTEGCVALAMGDLRAVLADLGPGDTIEVGSN
jgi:L,D-peptidoglycan transpeptidase YkuD (ErfK/YbiS/YcfS/YnhG family)